MPTVVNAIEKRILKNIESRKGYQDKFKLRKTFATQKTQNK